MKYNIQINQYVLAKKLDLAAGAILDYLYFLCNSTNSKIVAKRVNGMTWVNQHKVIQDMPMLKLKQPSISLKIKEIEKAGYIETRVISHKQYIKLTDKIDELFVKQEDNV